MLYAEDVFFHIYVLENMNLTDIHLSMLFAKGRILVIASDHKLVKQNSRLLRKCMSCVHPIST